MGNLIISYIYINIVGIVVFLVWLNFFIKFLKKKTNITKILSIFYGLYVIAFIFSIVNFYNLRVTNDPVFEVGTYLYYLFIGNFGYYAVIYMANFVFYLFYLEIFSSKEEENKVLTRLYLVNTIIGVVITLIPLQESIENMKLISGIILMVHSLVLYIPVSIQTFKLYKKVDTAERWAFFMLFLCLSCSFHYGFR